MARPKTPARTEPSSGKPTKRLPDALVTAARETYLAAWRWRRAVEKELREHGLTFTQWLVLEGLSAAIARVGDAVSQNDVARATELDRATVSQVISTLAQEGLVDRGPDFIGPGYRIIMTTRGAQLLETAAATVTAVTRTAFVPRAR